MSYNANFDLQGKKIKDTYQQVLQYETSSGLYYVGNGNSVSLSLTNAQTASYLINAGNLVDSANISSSGIVTAKIVNTTNIADLAMTPSNPYLLTKELYVNRIFFTQPSGNYSTDAGTSLWVDDKWYLRVDGDNGFFRIDSTGTISSSGEIHLNNFSSTDFITLGFSNAVFNVPTTTSFLHVNNALDSLYANIEYADFNFGNVQITDDGIFLSNSETHLGGVTYLQGSVIGGGNTISGVIVSGSLYGTSSNAISASWAPGGGLTTGATYAITSSWANSASIVNPYQPYVITSSSGGLITLDARIPNQQLNISTAGNYTFTASNKPPVGYTSDVLLFISHSAAATSSLTFPSTWKNLGYGWPTSIASNTVGTLWIRHFATGSTSIGTFTISGSTLNTSASWASSSLSSSVSTTSLTASYISSSAKFDSQTYNLTASWAINVVNASSGFTAVSQSTMTMDLKDINYTDSGGLSGIALCSITTGFMNKGYILPYSYINIPNNNIAGLGTSTTWAIIHQMRAPSNFKSGLTHSFQFFAYDPNFVGQFPGSTVFTYWEVALYAITSSINSGANFLTEPTLVSVSNFTKSFSGATETGSLSTINTSFNDPNGYISPNSILILKVSKIDSDVTSTPDDAGGSAGGDGTNYTGSLGLITSRYSWNIV